MGQIEDMNKNIETLTANIEKLGDVSVSMPKISIDISDADGNGPYKFMTDRQVMKKIIISGGDITGVDVTGISGSPFGSSSGILSDENPDHPDNVGGGPSAFEKRAHFMVYGKFLYSGEGENRKLVDNEILYPECVDKDHGMSDNHPMKTFVKKTKKEVKTAVKQLSIKTGEVVEAGTQLGIEVAAAMITLGASATILPPGSGLPVAFSAVLSIFASLQSFQTKITTILPILGPLTFLGVLLPLATVTVVIGIVNTALMAINTALGIVVGLIDKIAMIKGILLGAVPAGVEDVPGAGMTTSPAEPIELNVTANPSNVNFGETVKLKANATKGSWNYKYEWWAEPSQGFFSTEESPEVRPVVTTVYKVEVMDSNGSKKTSEVVVVLLQP